MKRLFSAILVTAMLLGLVACGGNNGNAGNQNGGSSNPGVASGTPQGGGNTSTPTPETKSWEPTKDIEFVIPFGAGGGNDVMVRKILEIIESNKMCPVNIVPVNKSGGSGVVGYTYLSSLGEGYEYALASTSASFYTQPLTGNSPFTPDENSFSFVAHMVKDPTVLLCNPNLGFTSVQDVVDYAKANPGALHWGGIGVASDDAIIMYMLNDLFDIDLAYVPYDAGGELTAALLGGHLDLAVMAPGEAQEHMIAGTLTPLAACADNRLPFLPDVPTFIEQGVDMAHQQSRGIVMNANVAPEVLDYYSDLLQRVSETPEWKQFVEDNAMADSFMGNEDYAAYAKEMQEKYTTYLALIPQG